MLDAVIGMQGEDGGARGLGVLARPKRGHRVGWHVLARFGHGLSGQCQALALLGRVPLVSLCCVDAPGQGQELKRGLEVEMPKVAGMATVCIRLGFLSLSSHFNRSSKVLG
jgi:hypothetical protein